MILLSNCCQNYVSARLRNDLAFLWHAAFQSFENDFQIFENIQIFEYFENIQNILYYQVPKQVCDVSISLPNADPFERSNHLTRE